MAAAVRVLVWWWYWHSCDGAIKKIASRKKESVWHSSEGTHQEKSPPFSTDLTWKIQDLKYPYVTHAGMTNLCFCLSLTEQGMCRQFPAMDMTKSELDEAEQAPLESQLWNESTLKWILSYHMWYRLFVPTPQVNKVPEWDFVRWVYQSANSCKIRIRK